MTFGFLQIHVQEMSRFGFLQEKSVGANLVSTVWAAVIRNASIQLCDCSWQSVSRFTDMIWWKTTFFFTKWTRLVLIPLFSWFVWAPCPVNPQKTAAIIFPVGGKLFIFFGAPASAHFRTVVLSLVYSGESKFHQEWWIAAQLDCV